MSTAKGSILNKKKVWIILGLLFLLAACRSPASTVKIGGNITPDPIVGRTATLSVEMVTEDNTDEGALQITLPDGIRLMSGNLVWKGSLIANTPIRHEIIVCVLYPLEKAIYLSGGSPKDAERVNLYVISSYDSAEVVPGSEYRYVQPSMNSTPTPTPSPDVVSHECLGES